MRDGEGNKLSLEEEQKVRSIQGTPDKSSLDKVSIDPNRTKLASSGEHDEMAPSKPATGAGE